jgi:hypothetical protein
MEDRQLISASPKADAYTTKHGTRDRQGKRAAPHQHPLTLVERLLI